MYRLLVAVLAAASCTSALQAQTSPFVEAGTAFSLEQALASAGIAAPLLEAAEADVRAADAARAVAGLRPNPEITVEAENVAGSGPYRGVDNVETTASFSLPIELGGKRSARIDVADARSRRARIESTIAEADLRLSVTQAYAETIAAERKLETARDQARIAADALKAAQVRVQAGRASPIEVQRADVARINADADVQRAERLATVSRITLSKWIGHVVNAPLDANWFTRLRQQAQFGPQQNVDSTGTLALAAAEADLAIADAGVHLARSQRIPDLTIGAGTRYMRETGDTAALFSLTIPLPLFNGGKAALAQASSERMSTEARRRAIANEVDQAIARAQAEVANAATSAAAASGPALTAAEETARIARIGYREGKFGQLDLLDAERTLAETRLTATNALLAYRIAEAQLQRLIARPLDLQGNNP